MTRTAQLTAGLLGVLWILSAVAGAAQTTGAEARLNVIFISLDTVRPDHLSCYGYPRQTTPHLDQIAKDGAVFTQAFAQASTTFPSHLALFTSRYPTMRWLSWESGELESSTESLTEVLKRGGYATAAFTGFGVSGPLGPLVQSRAFHAFDVFTEAFKFSAPSDDLFEWLRAHREEPSVLFLHGYDAHQPHVLPDPYDATLFDRAYAGGVPSTATELQALLVAQGLPGQPVNKVDRAAARMIYLQRVREMVKADPRNLKHVLALYDAQIYYLDQGLGRLLQALEDLQLMDRTIFVVVSDHGQTFNEHLGHIGTHGTCYDEVSHMVLIVRDPRLARRGRQVQQLVQAIDVMPTILELLDLPVPASAQGRSLVPLLRTGRDPGREEVALTVEQGFRALRTTEWKLIVREGTPGELYHLPTDPGEQHNVMAEYPKVLAQLQQQLDGTLPAAAAGKTVDPREWARQHGYW